MKNNRMTPVVIPGDESFSPPGHPTIVRDKHPTKIFRTRTRFVGTNAANPQMPGIERVDCNYSDSSGNARVSGWCKQVPLRTTIYRLINSYTGIRVDGQVRFAGAAINYRWVVRINRERTNVQTIVVVPN